jgi:hypothetical protein
MALQKTIHTNYGVDLTYWRITRMQIDWQNKIAEVFLGGWISRDARNANANAFEFHSVQFDANDWPFTTNGHNFTEAYDRIKLPIYDLNDSSNPDRNPFTGAADVYEPGQPGERP